MNLMTDFSGDRDCGDARYLREGEGEKKHISAKRSLPVSFDFGGTSEARFFKMAILSKWDIAVRNRSDKGRIREVDFAGRRWHGVLALRAITYMKKLFLFCVAVVLMAVSVFAADSVPAKSADAAWQLIETSVHRPLPKDPAQYLEQVSEVRSNLLEFQKNFPSDPRRWDAKLMRLQIETSMAQIQGRPQDDAAYYALTKQIIAAADAPEDTKADARYLTAERRVDALEASGSVTNAAARAAVEAAISDLRQNNPDDTRTLQVQFDLARVLKTGDPAATEAILRDLAGNKNQQAAALAQQQLAAMTMSRTLGKDPLDLKFDAVDGTKVDLAKLRGKVVLVDFWATWCGPCRMEIPNVVATYKKLHDRGFEIVGISLDQNKEQMMKFTAAAGMTWPEYFDGKSWQNEISTRYGISSIPTAWLVDKKGFVRSTEARGPDLAEQVKKLLAE